MTMKAVFPAITPARLIFVAIGVAVLTPFIWQIWWVPLSGSVPAALQRWVGPALWKLWPLAMFPIGFAVATYLMNRAGMMKCNIPPAQYPDHSHLSKEQFWAGVESGQIRPNK